MSKLILIPTPLDEDLPLEKAALELLMRDALKPETILLVEEHKVARQRWIKWSLPRDAINRFVEFNEHTQDEIQSKVVSELKSGKTVYLLSDGGLPAFCDPGQKLVKACHENKIKVTSTPFPNSVSLALAMSGIEHRKFTFAGFLSTNPDERKMELDQYAARSETLILMDTPYRLKALVADLGNSKLKNRKFFLATNLNSENEKLFYGSYADLHVASEMLIKPEFVIVISGS